MSWTEVVKKKKEPAYEENTKQKEVVKEKVITQSHKETPEELYDIFVSSKLFDRIIDIKLDCEDHTPWLLSKAHSHDILYFLNNYINMRDSLPKRIVKQYLDDSNEHDDETEYNEY